MNKFFLIMAICFSTTSMAQIMTKNYTQAPDSPASCFSPDEVIMVVTEDDALYFGGYTSNGGTYTLSDYSFTKINQGRFDERYEGPLGQRNSKVTNSFSNNVFSHTRTFFLSTRKNTFIAEFTADQLIIENKINLERPITCVLNLVK